MIDNLVRLANRLARKRERVGLDGPEYMMYLALCGLLEAHFDAAARQIRDAQHEHRDR